MTNLDSVLKSKDISLPTKVHIVKDMFFCSTHVWMWELDRKESWAPKNWCLQTVRLKTLESPLDCNEIKPVHPKGNQSWIFIGRTDAEAETPILWWRDMKNWLIGKDWCWERLKAREEGNDRGLNGWMASLTQWTWDWANSRRWWRTGKPGVLSPRGHRELGTTEWLNWTAYEVILKSYKDSQLIRVTLSYEKIQSYYQEIWYKNQI